MRVSVRWLAVVGECSEGSLRPAPQASGTERHHVHLVCVCVHRCGEAILMAMDGEGAAERKNHATL